MFRLMHVRHADGTVSTRRSQARTYTWAVEERRDLHAEAEGLRESAEKLEAELTSFDRAVASGTLLSEYQPWSGGRTYLDLYAEDPETGTRHWIGSQILGADGRPENPFDWDTETQCRRKSLVSSLERTRAEADELASGPRYAYCIVRWSGRKDLAVRAMSSFKRRGATYRVVEVVEGQPQSEPVREPDCEPAAEEAREVLEPIDPKRIRFTLGRAGFGGWAVRGGVGLGGYVVLGQAGRAEEEVAVFWRAPDDMPDEDIAEARAGILADYAAALEEAGYRVVRDGRGLVVTRPVARH